MAVRGPELAASSQEVDECEDALLVEEAEDEGEVDAEDAEVVDEALARLGARTSLGAVRWRAADGRCGGRTLSSIGSFAWSGPTARRACLSAATVASRRETSL